MEADPRHAELIVRELQVENCRTTRVPGAKAVHEKKGPKHAEEYDDDDPMNAEDDKSEG